MHVNARSSNHYPNHEADRDPKRLSERDSFLCEHSHRHTHQQKQGKHTSIKYTHTYPKLEQIQFFISTSSNKHTQKNLKKAKELDVTYEVEHELLFRFSAERYGGRFPS